VPATVPERPSTAKFVQPMLLLPSETLPEGQGWSYELKLDGYRALAIKTEGKVHLRSRNDNDFNAKYPGITQALSAMPDETVIDGEVVALDETGRPSFNGLQNYGSATAPIYFYAFDVLIFGGKNVMGQNLAGRRELLSNAVLPNLRDPIREAPRFDVSVSDLITAVRAQGLEGIVAKRLDSVYEPGARSGAWRKMRINRGQEFVIAGYTKGGRSFYAVVFGYYDGDRLIYVARTRNGFTPSSRDRLMERFSQLEIPDCPFANLPEARAGRWGQGLTADKMRDCMWLKPVLIGQFEFVEWTPDNHLRHSRFIGLREDKSASEVHREG
jgi:bifunctional non-homologous end joining protein LigD